MSTPTTTWAAIRAAIETAIRALAPRTHTRVPFLPAQDETDFREWAANTPDGCFRRYTIERGSDGFVGVTNAEVELRRVNAVLTVAYPTSGALYGDDNLRDLDDVIDADGRQIDKAIGHGGGASYASGVHMVVINREDVEREGPVAFAPLALEVTYDEAST